MSLRRLDAEAWLTDAQGTAGAAELVEELRRADQVTGQIECGPKDGGYSDDRELLATLAGQAATAIANCQARRATVRTGGRAGAVPFSDRGRSGRRATPDRAQRWLVATVEARAGRLPLPVAVRADAGLRQQRLDQDVEAAAYFVICEALTNVVKHADARETEVAMSAADGFLTLDVCDDGTGIAVMNGRGIGLTSLCDRVETLGGRLLIDNQPGAGTRVHAELPLARTGAGDD